MGRGDNKQGCGPWGCGESDTPSHSVAAACEALRCRALYSDVRLPVSSCPHGEPALPSFTDGETEAQGGHVSCWMSHRRGQKGTRPPRQGLGGDTWGSSEESQQQSGDAFPPPPPGIHGGAQPRAQEAGGPPRRGWELMSCALPSGPQTTQG